MTALLVEFAMRTPIKNPSGGLSRTFDYAGKVDYLYVDQHGMTVLRDWKCCSDAQQTSRLKMLSFQADLYAIALEAHGHVVDCAEYCLIERPTIKLCSKDATPEAYEERCYEWLQQPDKLMQFRVASTSVRRASARQWLWDTSQQILEARRSRRWVCNEQACYEWQRECPYMPLCLARAQGHDAHALVESDYEGCVTHPELSGMDGDVLTYSSASMFTLCQRKYYWRQECAIRPKTPDNSEALNNGVNVHRGLEVACIEGLEAGLSAVSPEVLGIDQFGLQAKAKARAMVRAAFERWGENNTICSTH